MFRQGSGFQRGRGYLWLARCLVGCLISGVFTIADAAAAPSEGELRAAVIVAIMRFTSWQAVDAERSELNVCLAGSPLSEDVLLAVSGEQKVATRTLNVRAVDGDVSGCQVMVIGEDMNDDQYAQLIAQTAGRAVLTVCDGCRRGLGEDAIILLRLRQQRVSFEVNLVRARSDGVGLDAQLLELAAVVRR